MPSSTLKSGISCSWGAGSKVNCTLANEVIL